MIKNITIKNFRSIESLNISCDSMTTFVGPNDVGKSNVLRALNLFFNGTTDHGVPFVFDKDFNKYAKIGKKQAKQIEIELTIALPDGFVKKGSSNEVVWRKVWREGGLHLPLMRQRYPDGLEFSPYSKIPILLERHAFYYVPAIKDRHFFTDLQGQMYDVLAEAAESKLRDSAKDFEGSIQNQITELMDLVSGQFGDKNEIRLPENLRIVFEALEFNADEMPLSRRGDGIKVRHIPMILKFLGEKRNALLTGGSIRYTNIWGFEEPENNVELSAAFDMARDFEAVARNDCQVFLTTHSPAFYAIGQEAVDDMELSAIVYGVKKDGNSTQIHSEMDDKFHDEMGLMPLIAPYVKKEKDRWSKLLAEKQEALEKLKQENVAIIPRMFVEGVSDKKIFSKVVELFYPHAYEKIKIDSGEGDGYGSANAVVSRALAWQLIQQTRRDGECPAAAIFDGDDAGEGADATLKQLVDELNARNKTRPISKSFKLKPNRRIGLLQRDGFKVSNDLESYYPDEIWVHALNSGWLEEADIAQRLSKNKINAYLRNQTDYLNGLDEAGKIRVKYKWKKDCKKAGAGYVCSLPEEECKTALQDIAYALNGCMDHLYPNNNA